MIEKKQKQKAAVFWQKVVVFDWTPHLKLKLSDLPTDGPTDQLIDR